MADIHPIGQMRHRESLDLDKELMIILYCARIYLNTCSWTILDRSLSKDIDWDTLIGCTLSHRMLYFTRKILDKYAKEKVPQAITAKMKSLCFENSMRTLVQSTELIQLLRLFEENAIPALPFKGPVLSQMIYQSQDARIFSDLDIFVEKKHAVPARDLLMENGFHTDVRIPPSQESAYLQKENFFHLYNPSGSVKIDLHWELTGRYTQSPVLFHKVIRHSCFVMLGGQPLPSLGYEDTLIYLCIHGCKNVWEKLEMLFSVAVIITSPHGIVWKDVWKKAEALGATTMVLLGLKLSHVFFHVPLPDSIQKKIASTNLERLCQYILIKIYSPQNHWRYSPDWRFSPFHFLIRDNIYDAIAYAARLLFQPRITDWQTCTLPDRLLFLYHLTRPCRLIREAAGQWQCHKKKEGR